MNEIGEQAVILRPVHESDLDALFRLMSDPESVRMAAFTPEDPDDRQRFDAHMVRVMESPEITQRAITWEGELVGSIASFVVEGQTEVTYWIDRGVWGGASPVVPFACFSRWFGFGPFMPGLRATTPAHSGCLRRLGSESSTRRCPSPRHVEPKSKRRSCGWASRQVVTMLVATR